jgi:phosphopantothenoylcysteine synthetase/decarboxylase
MSGVRAALTLVVCGAPLAERAPDLAAAAVAAGWDVHVVTTPAALGWLDGDAVRQAAGSPARVDPRAPGQPKQAQPAALAVCPATFNTVNKWAAGIADNHAMGVLCEAAGSGVPIVVVPMVKDSLWRHPAWQASLDRLAAAGVTFVDVRTGGPAPQPVQSGSGAAVAAAFDPAWILTRLA